MPESELSLEQINQKRGRVVPFIIIAFFISFMTPVIGFAVLAFKVAPSEVTQNAYEKGVAYNEILKAEAAQQALGWTITNKVNLNAPGGPALELMIKDQKGAALEGLTGEVRFIHPAHSKHDQNLTLSGGKDGLYSLPITDIGSGNWWVHVSLAKGKDQTQKRFSLML